MSYLIDSDIVSSYLGSESDVLSLVNGLVPAGISISTVTYMETMHGVLKKPDPIEGLLVFERGIEAFRVIPFDVVIAARCAQLRHELAQRGRKVRSRALDLMIAATAIEYQLVLVTRNRSDYADIPGLTMH
ncbi:MAG: type II toxin-antitoxin system VapC family toxin [Thermomicrobiales bacterium]|nr:type II toxin-antitoxin system VapC family toxin [Thermomicrobiales bacterium]